MAILGLMFLLGTVVFQISGTFPLSLRDLYGFSEAWIGLTLAVNTVIIILFEMVLVHSLAAAIRSSWPAWAPSCSAPGSRCCHSGGASGTSCSRSWCGRWGRC
jgi:hypothetical protein